MGCTKGGNCPSRLSLWRHIVLILIWDGRVYTVQVFLFCLKTWFRNKLTELLGRCCSWRKVVKSWRRFFLKLQHWILFSRLSCQKSGTNCGNVDGGVVRSGGGKQAVNGATSWYTNLLFSSSSENLIPDKILYSWGKFRRFQSGGTNGKLDRSIERDGATRLKAGCTFRQKSGHNRKDLKIPNAQSQTTKSITDRGNTAIHSKAMSGHFRQDLKMLTTPSKTPHAYSAKYSKML